jgi:atypical dual specificity phosphatase
VGLDAVSGPPGPRGFAWILPGRLAGCPEPGVIFSTDYDLDLLVRAGVTCLITLTEKDLPQDALARHGLINLHLPIYDREAPSIAQTYMLVRRMQLLLENGHVLAVHCKAGIGRTGSILAAWLIREGGLSADTAIQRLRAIKSTYVQTDIQEQFLHEFEQDMVSRL